MMGWFKMNPGRTTPNPLPVLVGVGAEGVSVRQGSVGQSCTRMEGDSKRKEKKVETKEEYPLRWTGREGGQVIVLLYHD